MPTTTTTLLALVGLALTLNMTEALLGEEDQTLENVSYGEDSPLHLLAGSAVGSGLLPHSRKRRAYQFPEGSNLEVKLCKLYLLVEILYTDSTKRFVFLYNSTETHPHISSPNRSNGL